MLMITKTETIKLNNADDFLKSAVVFNSAYEQVTAQYPNSLYLLFMYESTFTIQ
jgi:hypothetical protein